MEKRPVKRVARELTETEKNRLHQYREQIAAELPDLQTRDQMRKDARDEATLSGELRRAVHASDLSLAELATRIGITPIMLDDFLTGERTLRSDVLDRLAGVLGSAVLRVPDGVNAAVDREQFWASAVLETALPMSYVALVLVATLVSRDMLDQPAIRHALIEAWQPYLCDGIPLGIALWDTWARDVLEADPS